MKAFENKQLNLLNVHYGLRTLGCEVSNLFSLVYLYKQGLSLTATFLVYALMLCVRPLTRPLCLLLCVKKGFKTALDVSMLFFALRYLAMIPLDGVNWLLIPFMITAGLSEAFYPLPYHFYFTFAGSSEERGQSVGTREAVSTLISLIAPVLSGFLLAFSRPAVFILAAVAAVAAIIPLRGLPDLEKPVILPKKERRAVSKSGYLLFIGHGLFQQAINVWPVIVFLMLGENYQTFGLILGLAALFRVIGNFVFGHMIDSGKGFFVCAVGHILLIVTSAARGLWATTIPIVVLCDFFASVALCFYMPSVMAWTYNKMRTSSSPFYFDFYMEYGWETGAIAAMAFAAATAYFGIDIRWSMAAAALGAVWTMVPLCISYAKDEKKA